VENNNTSREVLLHRVQICDFVLQEVALFLDSHPNNQEALEHFRKYCALQKAAKDEYTQKYGPLTRADAACGDRWTWVDNPGPWENPSEV